MAYKDEEKIREYFRNWHLEHKEERNRRANFRYYSRSEEQKEKDRVKDKERRRKRKEEIENLPNETKLEIKKIISNKRSIYFKDTIKERRRTQKSYQKSVVKIRVKSYNITVDAYNALVDKQKDLCAICGKPERAINKKTGVTRALAIDHDHITGKIRGLLCTACNQGLGHFKDNTESLMKAIKYLNNNDTK